MFAQDVNETLQSVWNFIIEIWGTELFGDGTVTIGGILMVIILFVLVVIIERFLQRLIIRRFLSKDVPLDIIKKILADASRAPSGTNTQPWKVTCVTGEKKQQLSRAISDAIKNDQANLEYQYMHERYYNN